MTDFEILSRVKEHFEIGGIRDDGSSSEYYGTPDAFLKFAREIIEEHETTREHNLSKDEYFNSWRN
jgi:hypothetical protein